MTNGQERHQESSTFCNSHQKYLISWGNPNMLTKGLCYKPLRFWRNKLMKTSEVGKISHANVLVTVIQQTTDSMQLPSKYQHILLLQNLNRHLSASYVDTKGVRQWKQPLIKQTNKQTQLLEAILLLTSSCAIKTKVIKAAWHWDRNRHIDQRSWIEDPKPHKWTPEF